MFYKQAVRYNDGPPLSPQIVYVLITDRSYDFWNNNILDRADLANVNDALAKYHPQAVAYDIIFARPSNPLSDARFAQSLKNLGSVYLPIALDYAERDPTVRWQKRAVAMRLRTRYLKQPHEKGTPRPYTARRALMQFNDFAAAAFNFGHVGISSDADGVYRHYAMLVKVDSQYVPALALSIFLDYVGVSFDDLMIDWGHHITIPAAASRLLDQDVIIPIDHHGRTFIPYVQIWAQDFEKMGAHRLLQYQTDQDLQTDVKAFFAGKFVFVGDVSIGISDLGQSPLEYSAPLITIHAALLNGLLNNTFYKKWSFWSVIGLICLFGIILSSLTVLRTSFFLYALGGASLMGIIVLSWIEFINFSLMPIVSIELSFLYIFFGSVLGLQIFVSKHSTFIRHAFSKYVDSKVVNELLEHPDLLQLGGEERELTVLFSDLEGFTTISEHMSPAALTTWLNEYLTAMTDIIIAEGGMIDRYIGDAILAEFGAPLPMLNHADCAVSAGLKMQRRLRELHARWEQSGLPQAQCRIGINTGRVVLGNLGSRQIFNYTVTGDAANLGARLESANKQYQTYFMISEFTYRQLTPDRFRIRLLDVVKVQGKSQAVKIFEVYGAHADTIEHQDLLYYQAYHDAFEAYLSRHFIAARGRFVNALSLRPDDPAARQLIARIDALKPDDLADDWDGSVALTTK